MNRVAHGGAMRAGLAFESLEHCFGLSFRRRVLEGVDGKHGGGLLVASELVTVVGEEAGLVLGKRKCCRLFGGMPGGAVDRPLGDEIGVEVVRACVVLVGAHYVRE